MFRAFRDPPLTRWGEVDGYLMYWIHFSVSWGWGAWPAARRPPARSVRPFCQGDSRSHGSMVMPYACAHSVKAPSNSVPGSKTKMSGSPNTRTQVSRNVFHTFSAVLVLSPQTILTCWKEVPQHNTFKWKHRIPSGSFASSRSIPTTWLKR